MSTKGLTLVLADDHHLVREGLRLLLETRLQCRVVGEAATGVEAVALVRAHRPDILIVDLSMPGMSGIDVTRAVVSQVPETRVIVLSMHGDEPHVREALRAGAMAYVLKESLADDFLHAIAQVAAGQRYLSPRLAERAISSFAGERAGAATANTENLSPREREVLSLVAQGLTSAAIAERLGIGVRTVEWHRARLLHKLGLHSVADLVRYALQHGLAPETE
ncbi:MAG: response regulator transcription factor [Oscillochloridaceae bacterium]|nr:response regulator transcription factor [Chloroflexaceae bacterium]MDW8390845.1 response regulator transcription factor [Oscillochloridaceae bacterium]